MKPVRFRLMLSIVGAELLCFILFAGDRDAVVAEESEFEVFESRIVDVYEAKFDQSTIRSYLVDWYGDRVVVPDPSGESSYEVGAIVSVNMSYEEEIDSKGASHYSLHFNLVKPVAGYLAGDSRQDVRPESETVNFDSVSLGEEDDSVVQLPPSILQFKKKMKVVDVFVASYKNATTRCYLVEYDGNLMVAIDSRGETQFVEGKKIHVQVRLDGLVANGKVREYVSVYPVDPSKKKFRLADTPEFDRRVRQMNSEQRRIMMRTSD